MGYPCVDFVKWCLERFTTRAHFMRFMATLIIGVAAYQSLRLGKVEDTWVVLVGGVMGYYYRGHSEDQDKD